MFEAIKCLRAEGYKIALLTNNFMYDRLETYDSNFLADEKELFDVVSSGFKIFLHLKNANCFCSARFD